MLIPFFNAALMPISIGCFQDVTFGGKNFTVTFNLVNSFEYEGALSSKSRRKSVRKRLEDCDVVLSEFSSGGIQHCWMLLRFAKKHGNKYLKLL